MQKALKRRRSLMFAFWADVLQACTLWRMKMAPMAPA